jgi:hypothetical protein
MTAFTTQLHTPFPFGVRASRYLSAYRALEDLSTTQLFFPEDGMYEFWFWYAGMIHRNHSVHIQPSREQLDSFPEPNNGVCLWCSNKAAFAYTFHTIAHLHPTLLRVEDYSNFLALFYNKEHDLENRQSNLVLACLSAAMGYSVTYLSIERDDLLIGVDRITGASIEHSPEFITTWNRYHPRHRLRSCCAHLHKEEIIRELLTNDVPFSNCDNEKTTWCRDCFGCFEAYYSAKAIGLELGFRLTSRIYDQIYGHAYADYLKSGFKNDPANILHYFVRLQIIYKLKFERSVDCI